MFDVVNSLATTNTGVVLKMLLHISTFYRLLINIEQRRHWLLFAMEL
jgi:hypothetical protein